MLVIHEDYFPVDPNDTLNTGRIKWNTSIESIVASINNTVNELDNLTPGDINGLLVNGVINSVYLPSSFNPSAQNVTFSSPNFSAATVYAALEELYNSVAAVDTSGEAINITIDDIPNNFASTHVEGALHELHEMVSSILSSGGTGDVIGPVTASNNSIAVFDGTTGKIIKDSGVSTSSFALVSHTHSADNITSGVLAVNRGGTGIGLYNTGSYLRASNSTTLEQRTPAQVRNDIGAIPTTGGIFTGHVSFDGGLNISTSYTLNNNVPMYARDNNNNLWRVLTMNAGNNFFVGSTAVPLILESSTPVSVMIGSSSHTMLTSASSLNSLADVNTSGATSNQVLSWNGSTWVPRTVTEGGGGGGEGYLPLTGGTLTGNLSLNSRLFGSDGTAALPSITRTGDTDSGIYFPAADQVGITVGGNQRLNVSAQGLRVSPSGSSATPSYSFINDADTGFYNSEANTISLATAGAARLHISGDGVRLQNSGSAALPIISSQADQDTGIYFPAANAIAMAAGGSEILRVSSTGATVNNSPVLTQQSNLNALANVTNTTPNVNDVLTWNGSGWTPQAPTGGGGGGISNPLVTDLNANNFRITSPRIVGNQDVPVDAAGMIVSGNLTLTSAFNVYYLTALNNNLNINLPTVVPGNSPYGYITVRLTGDVNVNVSHTDGLIWEKLNLSDPDPVIPNTNGSVFSIYYRYDRVMQAYVVNITSLVVASQTIEIVPNSLQTSSLSPNNRDTHSFTHNWTSTVQDGDVTLLVGFCTDINSSKTITPPSNLTPLSVAQQGTVNTPLWWWGYYVPTQGDLNSGTFTTTFTVPNEMAQFLTFEVTGLDTSAPIVDEVMNYANGSGNTRNAIPSDEIEVERGSLTISAFHGGQDGNRPADTFVTTANPSGFTLLHNRPIAANSPGIPGWLVMVHTAETDGTISTPAYSRADVTYRTNAHAFSLKAK